MVLELHGALDVLSFMPAHEKIAALLLISSLTQGPQASPAKVEAEGRTTQSWWKRDGVRGDEAE